MGDGGELLLRERRRRNLFWTDENMIRLFWSWADGFYGMLFEQTVHTLYARFGIAPIFPTFTRELQHSTISKFPQELRIVTDRARYDIWAAAATESFGKLRGPLFLALAFNLCRFPNNGAPPILHLNVYGKDCFWNRPLLTMLVRDLNSRMKLATRFPQNDGKEVFKAKAKKIVDTKVRQICHQLKGVSSSQLELDQPSSVFDVTELLCQLFYTCLVTVRNGDLVHHIQEVLDAFCRREDASSVNGLDLEKESEMLRSRKCLLPLANLALTFVLNANSPAHTRTITSSGLEQLETWLVTRMKVVIQGDNIFSSTATIPAALIRSLIAFINKSGNNLHLETLPATETFRTGSCYDLVVKVDRHSSILKLELETAVLARVFHIWLGCRGRHQRMMQQIDAAYSRMGWPPCKNSSLLQEMRSILTSSELPEEQTSARYDIWLEAVPPEFQRMKCGKSFINFLAALSVEEVLDFDEESSGGWELVESVRLHATNGGYHLLNPLLLLTEEDEGVNELVLYLVEELCYWKLLKKGVHFKDFDDGFDFEYFKPDFPRVVRLPGLWTSFKSAVAHCRNVTEPVLRIVSTWQRYHRASAALESSKAWESLLYCFNIQMHGRRGGNMLEVTEQDLEMFSRAADDKQPPALVTGQCEISSLVYGLVEDLRGKRSKFSQESVLSTSEIR